MAHPPASAAKNNNLGPRAARRLRRARRGALCASRMRNVAFRTAALRAATGTRRCYPFRMTISVISAGANKRIAGPQKPVPRLT